MTVIKIDQLNIKLKGISAELTQDSLRNLGQEILAELIKQPQFGKRNAMIKISTIDSTQVFIPKNTNSSDLRKIMAQNIGKSITTKNISTKKG